MNDSSLPFEVRSLRKWNRTEVTCRNAGDKEGLEHRVLAGRVGGRLSRIRHCSEQGSGAAGNGEGSWAPVKTGRVAIQKQSTAMFFFF